MQLLTEIPDQDLCFYQDDGRRFLSHDQSVGQHHEKEKKVKLFTVRRQHRGGKHQEVLFSSLWKQNSPTDCYALFPRCTTSALTSKEARWASCVQSPGTTSTSGFCQLRWRFFHHMELVQCWSKNIRKCEHSTIKLQINHFCSFSRQTTVLRSAPISGGAGGNRNPRGTIFMFRSDTLTKLRQELVEFMESQGYRWIGTAGF